MLAVQIRIVRPRWRGAEPAGGGGPPGGGLAGGSAGAAGDAGSAAEAAESGTAESGAAESGPADAGPADAEGTGSAGAGSVAPVADGDTADAIPLPGCSPGGTGLPMCHSTRSFPRSAMITLPRSRANTPRQKRRSVKVNSCREFQALPSSHVLPVVSERSHRVRSSGRQADGAMSQEPMAAFREEPGWWGTHSGVEDAYASRTLQAHREGAWQHYGAVTRATRERASGPARGLVGAAHFGGRPAGAEQARPAVGRRGGQPEPGVPLHVGQRRGTGGRLEAGIDGVSA